MKIRIVKSIALPYILLFCVAISFGQPPKGDVDYSAEYAKITRTIENNFYDAKFTGLNWKAIKADYEKKVLNVHSLDEFDILINKFLGDLKSSHTAFYTPNDLEYYLLKSVFSQTTEGFEISHIGAIYDQASDGYSVRMVMDHSPAFTSGIHKGDIIVSADSKPFHPLNSFKGKEGSVVKLDIERNGRRMAISVTPVKSNLMQAFIDATQSSIHVIDQGGKKIGYIHLWCQSHPKFLSILRSAIHGPLANTDAIILDLRDGFGGSPDGYADTFFLPGTTIEWIPRKGSMMAAFQGRRTDKNGYDKPLIALINEGTRSAKEILSYELQSTHRATLIGTRTAGHVLGATGFPIDNVGLLELPVVDLRLDGKRLEGVGVSPDIIEAPSTNGVDKVLDRALVYLHAKLNKGLAVN